MERQCETELLRRRPDTERNADNEEDFKLGDRGHTTSPQRFVAEALDQIIQYQIHYFCFQLA